MPAMPEHTARSSAPANPALPSRLRTVLGMSACALALSACGGGGDEPRLPRAPEVAATTDGPVKAVDREGMRSYFAIPYAAPPVGAQRWQPPAAPVRWTAVREQTQSAAPCLQTSASPFRLSNDAEDCLYLDVHAPTGTGPFPVMVWIHGGAFNTGGTATYSNPSPLVSKGMIVVNIAYRLGAMGFLGHPSLAAADGSVGNYGIMDQQAALRWVQNNIAAFGGDKNNVTIFGESAGGFGVMTHLASPLSKGLFHKAIVQSGNYANDRQQARDQLQTTSTAIVEQTLDAATAAGVSLPSSCDRNNITAECLRALPDTVVRNQLATRFNANLSSPVPAVDGRVLTASVKDTFIAGNNNKVPVINGSNQDEWSLFIAIRELSLPPLANTNEAYQNYLQTALGIPSTTASSFVNTVYPLSAYDNNTSLAATAVGTDRIFACPALQVSKRMATQPQPAPVYMYEFRDQTALPSITGRSDGTAISFSQGASHSYELQYLFKLRNDLGNDERRALQTSISTYWTNFARSSNPNTGRAVPATWPRFTKADEILGLDVASDGGIRLLSTFEVDHKCATTWSSLTF